MQTEMTEGELEEWYKALKGHGELTWPCTIIHHSKERAEKEMLDFTKKLNEHGWLIEGSSQLLDGLTPDGKRFWRKFYYASKAKPADAPKHGQISTTDDVEIDF